MSFSAAVGAGVFSSQSIYKGGENQTQPFPYLELEYGPLFFSGGELGVFVGGVEEWGLGMALTVGSDFVGNTEYDDSPELADLKKLDNVINGSINVFWETNYGEFGLAYSTDISNKHDGNSVRLSYGKMFQYGKWLIGPELSVIQNSEEVTQYYYGVKDSQTKAGRPVYTPGKSKVYTLGLNVGYEIDEHHSLMGMVGATSYGNEIYKSPIVQEKSSVELGLFYLYKF